MDDMRKKVAELDREEKLARNAEMARVHIRLGTRMMFAQVGEEREEPRKSVWMKLGFKNSHYEGGFKQEHYLSPREVDEVYDALAIVRDDHQRRAMKLAEELGTEAKF